MSKKGTVNYFRHSNTALDDDFIVASLRKFGAKGYLIWFGTLELCSAKVASKEDDTFTFDEQTLRYKFRVTARTLREYYAFAQHRGRIEYTYSELSFHIKIVNLLKYMGSYHVATPLINKQINKKINKEIKGGLNIITNSAKKPIFKNGPRLLSDDFGDVGKMLKSIQAQNKRVSDD